MLPISLKQALSIARDHADAGRLSDAEGLCRRILQDDRNNAGALRLLGSVICRAGRPYNGVPFLTRAAEQAPGDLLLQLELAKACSAASQFDAAIAAYRRCIELAPEDFNAHAQLGILLNQSGDPAQAVVWLTRAVELAPNSAEFHFHLGVALGNLAQTERAIAAYEKAIALDPALTEAHANLGVAYRAVGKSQLALAAYGRALALNPDSAEVHCNLGVALAEYERMPEAIGCYERAIALNPDFANAHFNLANALSKADEHERAIACYRRAIELDPGFVQAHSNMAMSFNDLGLHELALQSYDRAVELKPEWAEARWNRALTHLLFGNFDRGWAEFDCRNQVEPPSSREFPGQRWNGEDLTGKTIVFNYEMGLGDAIHFVRYVPLVAWRAAHVILECQEPLRELFRSVPGVHEVVSLKHGDASLAYDVHCSLMRLPELFRSNPRTMPRTIPYLRVSEDRIEKWHARLGPRSSKHRIGLVWAGSPEHQNDRQRSIPLNLFAPLAAIPHTEFVSLQRGPASEQAKTPPPRMKLINPAAEFENMADTAAVIEQLDLVISVDTSVAHLAGALGKRVWVLLAYVPDWRWMLDRSDTPWYPQMRLFRQPRIGDWATPMRQVAEGLEEVVHGT